jgi:sugar/nucleoside kinase (ribokinase family)
LGLDVQGYVRILQGGTIVHDSWPENKDVLRLVDVLKADIVEAGILTGRALSGTEDLKKAALELADRGPGELVLTHGEGVVVYAAGKFHEAPFLPKAILGRSGRGDTCLAAYLARRVSHDPADAAVWAAALTTIKLETAGPFSGTADDVERRIDIDYRMKKGRGSFRGPSS